jgi:hypothetical protein
MIKIIQNPNFTKWFNILFDGRLVDNAKSHAQAMRIASKLESQAQDLREPIRTGARISL